MNRAEQGGGPRGLAGFEGLWQLSRRIDDRRAGQELRLEGTLRFTPDGPGRLRCEERGRLELPGRAPAETTRELIWQEAPGGIEVLYSDGRFFHLMPLAGGPVRHDCAPDLYEGDYDFSAWPRWRLSWQVRGPRKDYTMISEHWR